MTQWKKRLLPLLLALMLALSACGQQVDCPTGPEPGADAAGSITDTAGENNAANTGGAEGESGETPEEPTESPTETPSAFSLDQVPAYSGQAYAAVHDNEPYFTADEDTLDPFETYSDLDSLGRCGVAYANICKELMPTEKRESIGQVKPSGWQTAKYDFVDGQYLYNRCHLIGFQLAGENANEKNLITGTRYLNVQGMLPFENLVADYVKETGNHVLYRVTPVFEGDELVARGVLMEARSVEDEGDGVLFCVWAYNVQPGVTIDYATGKSTEDAAAQAPAEQPGEAASASEGSYVLNTGTMKFHTPDCASVGDIKEENRRDVTARRDDLVAQGYAPCGRCKP